MRMKYVVIIGLPLLFLAAVLLGGEWMLDRADSPPPEAAAEAPPPLPAPPVAELTRLPAAPPEPAHVEALATAAEEPVDDAPAALVPADLATPLRAVAPDVSLCIPATLERDKGPLDVEVHFTPTPGGAFAEGTEVTTSWDDDEHTVAHCIAEVFDETSFWPAPPVRFQRSAFVFHFPDDAMHGLLGMHYSPFQ